MSNVANAVNFVSMIVVLFIGARMWALQMDPVNGAPQAWAQNCFDTCTYEVLAQVLIFIAVMLALSRAAVKGEVEGEMVYEVAKPDPGS